MCEDLRWFGFHWSEGPDVGGRFAPYNQSERMPGYRGALERLRAGGFIYPCTCSRRDVQSAVTAPHAGNDEPIYSGKCRSHHIAETTGQKFSWRFRVPDGETIAFHDENMGEQPYVGGRDFGDFVVWRPDNVPAYQLACVVDDVAMKITEVVRGADLLVSTARQVLIYRALGWTLPRFYHCQLMLDEQGRRLAKRHESLSLRKLRAQNLAPESVRKNW